MGISELMDLGNFFDECLTWMLKAIFGRIP